SAPRRWGVGGGRGDRIQYYRPARTLRHGDGGVDAGLRSGGDPGVLRSELRGGAGARDRRAVRQGAAHRAYGVRERADDPGHAERGGDGARGAWDPARTGWGAGGDRLAG